MRSLIASTGLLALVCFADSASAASPAMSAEGRIVDADLRAVQNVSVTVSQHERLWASRPVGRVAVGDEEIAGVSMITSKEILVLGREAGRTSITLWFRDGRSEVLIVDVQADLSVLQASLAQIHPSIVVSGAPDRDALVLRGLVPTLAHARAAQEATIAYSSAGTQDRSSNEASMPVYGGSASANSTSPAPSFKRGLAPQRSKRRARRRAAVINLIQVVEMPPDLVQRVRQTLAGLGADLRVSRIQHGLLPNDAVDTVLIEGRVDDPARHAQLVQVASRLLGDPRGIQVEIVADDSGALPNRAQNGRGGGSAAGRGASSGASSGASAGGARGRNGNSRQRGQLGASPSRARGLSLAGGRGLMFVQVDQLPQVNVSVRLYELNRARLRDLRSTLDDPQSDVPPGMLIENGDDGPGQDLPSLRPEAKVPISEGIEALLGLDSGNLTGGISVVNSVLKLRYLLTFLVSKGVARSLSSPSLTVLSGEDAEFQMGGDVPVPQLAPAAMGTIGTTNLFGFTTVATFREFGVRLEVRPLVHPNGDLTLHLRPEVSEPDAGLTASLRNTTGNVQAATAFSKRFIDTTTRLRDGESLVVGGLFSRRSSLQDDSNPVLSRIPLLGWMFQQWGESDDERELIIVVEPTIQREPSPRTRHWMWPSLWPDFETEDSDEEEDDGDGTDKSDGSRPDTSRASL